MPVNPNWGISQPVDIGGMFNNGVQAGRQRRIETETDNALRQYAQNPNDPNAVNSLLRFNPQMGMQLRQQQQEQQRRVQSQAQTGAALGGDMQQFAQLAQTDPEQFARIRPQIEQMNRTIGDIAMASTTPEQWDANVNNLVQQYGEGFARYRGRFDLRDVAIAQSGQMREWLASQEPRIQSVPVGGALLAMDRNGGNAGYIAGGPEGAPVYTPPNERAPQMAPQVAPQTVPQALTPDEGGRILSTARQSRTISAEDAQRMVASLGPNGQAQFQQWAQANGVTVGQTAPTLTLDAIDAELRRRGVNQ